MQAHLSSGGIVDAVLNLGLPAAIMFRWPLQI
jgi:hypothetical protein